LFFFFQAEDGIRYFHVTGVQTCALPILVFSAPEGLTRYAAEKGSIAVSGVSLTVTHVDEETFGVSLIPTTLEATILGGLTPGDRVNLEVDVLAKYVERLLVSGVVAGRAS